jgi:polyferredoxin
MGIDIRDGQQLECITCALCIDACDAVMDKVGKARGLIAYATLAEYESNMALATAGGTSAIDPRRVHDANGKILDKVATFHIMKLLRPRTLIYLAAWSLVGLGLLAALLTRDRLQLNVLADRNPQFVVLADGSIRNGYTIKLLNMVPEPRTITVTMQGLPGGEMSVLGMDQPPSTSFAVQADPDRLKTLKVFVRQPREKVAGPTQHFRFVVEDKSSFESDHYDATFDAPEAGK